MAFNLFDRLFNRHPAPPPMDALYRSVVAVAREPRWYTAGTVPDTLDGRFDMVALVLSLVLIRLESAPGQEQNLVSLTERFVADMDGSLREIGVGDLVVGKHIGKMMGALEGRLGAYRAAFAGNEVLADALARNLYRGAPVDGDALAWAAAEVVDLNRVIDGVPLDRLLDGEIPR
ncbi:ubiquinol-cytochrome C chaperone family protein [Sphingoaurantiacus capsulatus]|uniref:Ubiquinol-cytochrome C chaperone family protein n=1 Tax=Sphingoaurantiacus capsulatus TaxID=1771310 RepID=A0ABV7X9R3_9SPHN